jgi:hypothetical protein
MKTLRVFLIIVMGSALVSCGTGTALMVNQNHNTTHVHLGSANYKVVGRATGTSEVEYVCLIGGLNKKQIYENAYAQMVADANLDAGSRALINVVTEEHIGGVPPFYFKRKITVNANVIEFK